MSNAAAPWQPTSTLVAGEPVRTVTRPVSVMTDAGPAFLKPVWEPGAGDRLMREMIGLRLAAALGLDAPRCAVYALGPAETVADERGVECEVGPALLVEQIVWNFWDGTSLAIKRLANKGDLAGLIVLDTWLRNTDRFPPVSAGGPQSGPDAGNLQNVALSPGTGNTRSVRLRAVDFSETLHPGIPLNPALLGAAAIEDPRIYGFVPQFIRRLRPDDFDDFLARLGGLPDATITGIVSEVPAIWWPDERAAAAVEAFLQRRRKVIRNNTAGSLAPLMGWLGGN